MPSFSGSEGRRLKTYRSQWGAHIARANKGADMTRRDIQKFNEAREKENDRIRSGQYEPREIIEAGSQFDYMLRKIEHKGLDFRAEW